MGLIERELVSPVFVRDSLVGSLLRGPVPEPVRGRSFVVIPSVGVEEFGGTGCRSLKEGPSSKCPSIGSLVRIGMEAAWWNRFG